MYVNKANVKLRVLSVSLAGRLAGRLCLYVCRAVFWYVTTDLRLYLTLHRLHSKKKHTHAFRVYIISSHWHYTGSRNPP